MIKKIVKKILIKFHSPVLNSLNRLSDISIQQGVISTELEKSEFQRKIEHAYKAGYNYHQKIIKYDSEMQKWIMQEHYFY